MIQVLRAADRRTMPWKNGGGSTIEIAVAPEGAGLDDFDWRLSMALVAADGPFSMFPGVDRTLTVLDGAGLVLHGLPDGPVRLDRQAAPLRFPADVAVDAALVDGPITDLNVMVRRRRFRDRVRRLTGDAAVSAGPDAAVAFLLAWAPCRIAVAGPGPVDLERRDALRIDDPAGRTLSIEAGGTVEAYLVELIPH